MSSAVEAIDIGALKRRYPEAFATDTRARIATIAIVALMGALYVGSFAYFDVPWGRLGFRPMAARLVPARDGSS